MKKKILFLGETYRADAQTWINGLKEFGDFDIVTFEVKARTGYFGRLRRNFEFLLASVKLKKIIKEGMPDMVIAERITSYGFLAALSKFPKIAVAQQGITDIFPANSISAPIKRLIQKYVFRNVQIIHAWGEAMTASMYTSGAKYSQIIVLPKGIDLRKFNFELEKKSNLKIHAIVTRSLFPEYRHEVVLKAFKLIKDKGIPFNLVFIGDGVLYGNLTKMAFSLGISEDVQFLGRIDHQLLPKYLSVSNVYISMPMTEGVSASLFEAMATGCYPIVSDLRGNRSWLRHRVNGSLVRVDDFASLANEIEYYWKNIVNFQEQILTNRKFIESNVSYEVNMNRISQIYHNFIAH